MTKTKANEHSIRTYWRDILNDLLRGKNIDIIYDPTIVRRKGQRYPDFLINNKNNEKTYILETKVGDKFYTDAVVDGINKMMTINADAAIAVAFPDKLLDVPLENVREAMDEASPYKAEIRFNTDKYTLNKKVLKSQAKLHELNNFIIDILIHKELEEKEELDIKQTIHTLREDVNELYQKIKYLDTNDVKSLLGGKTLFENVLGYGDDDIQKASDKLFYLVAYLLLNQLLFYNIIQKHLDSLPKLSLFTVNSLDDIKEKFKVVRKRNWEPVFGYDILSLIIKTLPKESDLFQFIRYILQDIEELTKHEITNEILGILFHEIIPLEIRKVVAAYYTGNEAGELLSWLSIEDKDAKLIDPACGSGSLLTAAYRRKRTLCELNHPFTAQEHKQFVESDITGIDIMPFAAHLATINLSLQAPIHYTNKIQVGTEDSTKLNPGDIIHQTFDALKDIYDQRLITLDKWVKDQEKEDKKKRDRINKGPISLSKEETEPIEIASYDLVIMNPPFTRAENLVKIKFKSIKKTKKGEKEVEITYKDILYDRFSEYKKYLNSSMGLFAYFILLGDRLLRESGTIAAVLPSSILRLKSTHKIRKFIIKNYIVKYIITRRDQSAFSENTSLREILFVMQKKSDDVKKVDCKYVSIKELPSSLEQIHEMAEMIERNELSQDKYNITDVSQDEMKETVLNWYTPISENEILVEYWEIMRESDKCILHTNFVSQSKIIRGVESPNVGSIKSVSIVDPLYKSGRDVWIFKDLEEDTILIYNQKYKKLDNQSYLEEYEIPSIALVHAFRTPSGIPNINVKNLRDFLIIAEFPKIKEVLASYIDKSKGDIKLNFLKKWVPHCERRSSNLFHSRRVNLSAPGTKLLGFYSSPLRVPTKLLWSIREQDEETAKIIALWYNSSFHLLQILINRIETEGAFIEIGKYTFKSFRIIDPYAINSEEKKQLINLFESIEEIEFPSILEQLKSHFKWRVKIDDIFLKLFGVVDKEKRHKRGKILREELYREIMNLKNVMKGD